MLSYCCEVAIVCKDEKWKPVTFVLDDREITSNSYPIGGILHDKIKNYIKEQLEFSTTRDEDALGVCVLSIEKQ